MAVSMEFLRGVLGVIGIACAYMTGRTFAMVRKGWTRIGKLYAWVIRLVLCLAAVAFRRPVDAVDLAVWLFAAVAFAAAFWDMSREKKEEDLTHTIFPDES